MPNIAVSQKHRIGSIFEINGVQFPAELDSGWQDDPEISLKLAEKLGFITITNWTANGKPEGAKLTHPEDTVAVWPHGPRTKIKKPRIWVDFNIPGSGLPPVRTLATINVEKEYSIVPVTLLTAIGYSVKITSYTISYEPAHEGGVPYNLRAWDPEHWTRSPEHRTPPFLNFAVDGQEYPALLDTGAIGAVFSPATAKMLGLTRFPRGPMVDDKGLKESYMVPIQFKDIILPPPIPGRSFLDPAEVNGHYPAGNLVPAELFIENGYSLTFNPNSLEVG